MADTAIILKNLESAPLSDEDKALIRQRLMPTPPPVDPATSFRQRLDAATPAELEAMGYGRLSSALPPGPLTPFAQRPPATQADREAFRGALPAAGGLAGGLAGSTLAAASGGSGLFAVPGLAGLGAMAGKNLETWLLEKRAATPGESLGEFAMSAAPEVAVRGAIRAGQGVTKAVRNIGLWHTRPGKIAREAEQFTQAVGNVQHIFNTPTDAEVSRLFDAIDSVPGAMGVRDLGKLYAGLSPAEKHLMQREFQWVDVNKNRQAGTPTDRSISAFGRALEQRAESLTNEKLPYAAVDPTLTLKDAQALRSGLRQHYEELTQGGRPPNDRATLIQAFQKNVDQLVEQNLVPGGQLPPSTDALVAAAHDAYQRKMAAETLGNFFLLHSDVPTKNATIRTLNLQSMVNDLAKNTTPEAQEVNRYFQALPATRSYFDAFVQHIRPYSKEFEMLIPSGLPSGVSRQNFAVGLARGLAESLISVEGAQKLLRDIPTAGYKITPHLIAGTVSAARRELLTPQTEPTPLGTVQLSPADQQRLVPQP